MGKKIISSTKYNIVYNLSSKCVVFVLYFFIDILCARLLTYSEYSEWNLYYSIISVVFWIVWFGVNAASRVKIAMTVNDEKEEYICLISSVILRILISTILCIVFFCFSPFIANIFNGNNKYNMLDFLLVTGTFIIFFNSFTEFFKDIFIGLKQLKKVFWLSLIENISKVFFIVLVFFWGGISLYSLNIAYILAGFLTTVIFFVTISRDICNSKPLMKADKNEILMKSIDIFKYAIPMLAITIGGMIIIEMDSLMLGLLKPEDVGIYSVAKKISGKATHLNLAIISVIAPVFATITTNNLKKIAKTYRKTFFINIGIAIFVSLILYIFSDIIILILYGEEFKVSSLILKILIPYYIFYCLSVLSGTFLDYQGKAIIHAILYFVVIGLNFMLNYYLIPKMGAKGAAIASSIAMFVYLVLMEVMRIQILKKYKMMGD